MTKVDPQRLRKHTRLPSNSKPKKAPPPTPVERVKGVSDPIPRWTAHRRNDDATLAPEFFDVAVGDQPHVVFLAFKLAFDAGRALRLLLSRQGVSLEAIDDLRVKAYAPNGWTPKRAVLVSEHPTIRGEIVVEPYDLEAEMETP